MIDNTSAVSDLLPEEELLLQTAEWFEEDPLRWHQGSSRNEAHTAHCTVGALGHPLGGCGRNPDWDGSLFSKACRRLQKVTGYYYAAPWNDDPERTVYDVIDALRRAAKPEFRQP